MPCEIKTSEVIDYTCNDHDCSKSFSTQQKLTKHEYTHSYELFFCDFCNKSYSTPESLQSHRNTHIKPEDTKCILCDKVLATKQKLTTHIDKVHQVAPQVGVKSNDIEKFTCYSINFH